MTVAELIRQLRTCPDLDALVAIRTPELRSDVEVMVEHDLTTGWSVTLVGLP